MKANLIDASNQWDLGHMLPRFRLFRSRSNNGIFTELSVPKPIPSIVFLKSDKSFCDSMVSLNSPRINRFK